MINSNDATAMQNAYQFIIDSINDGVEFDMIESLDPESMREFAEIYETTNENIERAINTMRILRDRLESRD